MDIVSWSLETEAYDQNKPIYIDRKDPARYLSAKQVRTQVRQLVSGLKRHGLEKSDCVCVVGLNDVHYTSLFLGIIGAGGCFSGANPGYTAHELTHHVRITQAKFILASLKTLDIAVAAADSCGIPQSKIFVLNLHHEEIPEGQQSWNQLLKCGEQEWERVDDPDNTPAAYVSTSGTSGLPKAAIIPHSYLVSQAEFQVKTAAVRYKLSTLIAIPPFHVFTIPVQHALPLRKGTPTYIMPRFEAPGFLDAIETFRISHTIVVPPILMALANCSESSQLKSLKRIYVGGSCATDGMQQQLYAKLSPSARIEQVYGMTETGWSTTWHDRNPETTGSVGRPLLGTELRLVDKSGQAITEEGVNGEIHIHCPHPMKGYLNNATATAEAFTADDWIRTGDVGYIRDGKWYVVDRTKDLIKVRGWQVSPVEIEAVLLEHPSITDAAVIGVPAQDGTGEVPIAFVVKRDETLQEKSIQDFLVDRLARYKGVDEVIFVDTIPRNPTGKILRRVLRDARGVPHLSTGQAAASAYSNAIKDLEKYQQERIERESAVDGAASPRSDGSPTNSRRASLTDASTMSQESPRTPPADSVAVRKRRGKRAGEPLCSPVIKRRSLRLNGRRDATWTGV